MVRRATPTVVGSAVERTAGHVGRKRSRAFRVLVCLGMLIAIVGCRTYRVKTDWDRSVALDGLSSFYFEAPPESEGADPFADNSLLRKRIRLAVEAVLSERDFRSASSRESADLVLTYVVILNEEMRSSGYSTTAGGAYRRGGAFGQVYSTTDVRTFQESTLILDLLDPSSDDLVWRGWGIGIVGTRDRNRGQEKIEKGVRAILAEFPP